MRRLLLAATVLVCVFLAGVAFADHYESTWHSYHDSYLLNGLSTIPDDAIVLSKAQTRRMFAVSDEVFGENAWAHHVSVREAACLAFIIPCDDYNNISTTPFTFLVRDDASQVPQRLQAFFRSLRRMGNTKIVTISSHPLGSASPIGNYGASLPWLTITSAGNSSWDEFFNPKYFRYDRKTGAFVGADGYTILPGDMEKLRNIREAVEANTVIYASGYYVEGGKPHKTDWFSGCIGVEESCVYVPGIEGGTSSRSPTVGSALASLLTVFPDYDVFNLARLTSINGCAKQYPTLPGGGIVDVPCMIETICAEDKQQLQCLRCRTAES